MTTFLTVLAVERVETHPEVKDPPLKFVYDWFVEVPSAMVVELIWIVDAVIADPDRVE